MRVLLIEDDRMIGTAMQQALKDAAYAVDWVTDGETAIHAAENESYELALVCTEILNSGVLVMDSAKDGA